MLAEVYPNGQRALRVHTLAQTKETCVREQVQRWVARQKLQARSFIPNLNDVNELFWPEWQKLEQAFLQHDPRDRPFYSCLGPWAQRILTAIAEQHQGTLHTTQSHINEMWRRRGRRGERARRDDDDVKDRNNDEHDLAATEGEAEADDEPARPQAAALGATWFCLFGSGRAAAVAAAEHVLRQFLLIAGVSRDPSIQVDEQALCAALRLTGNRTTGVELLVCAPGVAVAEGPRVRFRLDLALGTIWHLFPAMHAAIWTGLEEYWRARCVEISVHAAKRWLADPSQAPEFNALHNELQKHKGGVMEFVRVCLRLAEHENQHEARSQAGAMHAWLQTKKRKPSVGNDDDQHQGEAPEPPSGSRKKTKQRVMTDFLARTPAPSLTAAPFASSRD